MKPHIKEELRSGLCEKIESKELEDKLSNAKIKDFMCREDFGDLKQEHSDLKDELRDIQTYLKTLKSEITGYEYFDYCDVTWGETDDGKKYPKEVDFKPKLLADDILNDYPVVRNENLGKLFIWRNGVWQENKNDRVKSWIENCIQNRVGDDWDTKHASKVWKYVQSNKIVKEKHWQSPNHLINVENGVIDLKKKTLREKTRHHHLKHKIWYPYEEDAECPKFEAFLKEILPNEDDRRKVLESLGRALVEDIHGKALMMYGDGSNGKTLLLRVFTELIEGENHIEKSLHDLEDGFDTDALYGKIVMTDEDISSQKLEQETVSMFKKMTDGSKMPAEEKYGDIYDFRPMTTPIFCANHIPPTPERQKSFFRRWTIVEFPVDFKEDPDPDNPLEKQKKPKREILNPIINNEEEMKGILRLLVQHATDAYERGEVHNQRHWKEIRDLWEENSHPVYAFLKKYVREGVHPDDAADLEYENVAVKANGDFIKKDQLLRLIKAYNKGKTDRHITKKMINDALNNLGYRFKKDYKPETKDGSRPRVYGGLVLDVENLDEKYLPLIEDPTWQSVIYDSKKLTVKQRLQNYMKNEVGDRIEVEALKEEMIDEELLDEEEEQDFEEAIERMKKEGVLFEPKSGKISLL